MFGCCEKSGIKSVGEFQRGIHQKLYTLSISLCGIIDCRVWVYVVCDWYVFKGGRALVRWVEMESIVTEDFFMNNFKNYKSFNIQGKWNATLLVRSIWLLKESVIDHNTKWEVLERCMPSSIAIGGAGYTWQRKY